MSEATPQCNPPNFAESLAESSADRDSEKTSSPEVTNNGTVTNVTAMPTTNKNGIEKMCTTKMTWEKR